MYPDVHEMYTVEHLIKDPPRRGLNLNNLSTKDIHVHVLQSPKCSFSHILNTF